MTALSPLIGAESELGHAVKPGWAALSPSATGKDKELHKDKIDAWSKKGMELELEVKELIEDVVSKKWEAGFRAVRSIPLNSDKMLSQRNEKLLPFSAWA